MSKVEIFSTTSTTEAHLLQGLLAQFGIEAHISGHYLQGAFGELPMTNMIQLLVEKHTEQRAIEILERYERGEFAHDDDNDENT